MKVLFAFLVNTLCNFAIGLLVAKFLGPEEFGRFALALAIGVVLQTAFFEWIRQSAIRFYSQRSRLDSPELRSTLDFSFAAIATFLALIAVGAILAGVDLPLSNALIALAVVGAIANGFFDFHTAMVRARFDDALYGRLVLTKNVVALFVTAGGAFLFHSATMALFGVCVSMAGSILIYRKKLRDDGAPPNLAHRAIARKCFIYAAPIIVANLLIFALMPMVNRALMARWFDYAETGQFALANDIGTRMVMSIGSSLDVLLFQLAVRADEQHGGAHGRSQIALNMAIIFAILMPACVGVWLTLPSIERLVVPEQFRGPFQHYFSILLPGQFAFALFGFAIVPYFQIAKRTLPMILAAALACVADIVLIFLLPPEPSSIALAQSGAMIFGLLTLTGTAYLTGAQFPPMRDLFGSLAGAAAMVAALWPLRSIEPGALLLAAQVVLGIAIYGAFVAMFDIAGLRGAALGFVETLRSKVSRG